jgi:hypothetical protein
LKEQKSTSEDWQERWMVWVGDKALFTLFWGDDGSKEVECQLRSIEDQMKSWIKL